MALDKHILKNTDKETIVSIAGANDTATISLADLVTANQRLGATGATGPTVNVATVITSGDVNSSMTIRRGATGATGHLVFAGAPENAPTVQFNQYGFTESAQNTQDILVTHSGATGAQVTSFIVLRKIDGYNSTIETAEFSIYDDVTKVGE
jgi:hypothetical protein